MIQYSLSEKQSGVIGGMEKEEDLMKIQVAEA
jgi:hypothetical protein